MATSHLPSMRMPVEVLEAVIDQASDNPRTLRHLSLTCATLLPRSRLHLFRNIVIKTEEQLWSSSEFLDSHPWLVSLIQKVTLRPDEDVEHGPKLRTGVFDTAPIHLLRRLPNLHVWRMSEATNIWLSLHRSALLGYRQYGDHIRCLELYSTRFNRISDFKGLVSAFTRLDTLKCHSIEFRRKRCGDSPVMGGMNNQSLSISTLRITSAVDSHAMEYLLVHSGSKLKNLTLALSLLSQDDFERLEQSMMSLTGLSSLLLVLCPMTDYDSPSSSSPEFSNILLSTTKILQQVHRRCLRDVQVEFISDSIADLAIYLSKHGALCKDLEAAILTFPKAPLLVRDPVRYRRAGRAELWSPFIHRAFPNLNHRGLLAFERTPSNVFSPDPVGHEFQVESMVFSPDSAQVITTSRDGTIIIWDMASGTVLREWLAHDSDGGSPFSILVLSSDGRRLVSSGGNTVTVWDIDRRNSARKVAELEGHADVVSACAWSPDGALIASGSRDGTVRIWDGETYQQRKLLDLPSSHMPSHHSMKFSPDGRYLAWISSWKNCWVWTPLAEEPPKMLRPHPDRQDILISVFSFDHESHCIATAHRIPEPDPDPDACIVRIWDAATGAPLAVLTGHCSKGVSNVCFTLDGRSLLSVSEDMDVRVWDCGTWSGEQAGVFGETDRESHVSRWNTCFRHDGRYMAADFKSRGTVQVWRTGDGSCVATFGEHDSSHVTRIAFSPDGQFLVYGDGNGIVHIRHFCKYIDE